MNASARTGVKWGVILGVAVCLWTAAVHLLGFYTTNIAAGKRADVAATVLPIAALFLAIRERRSRNPDGSLTMGQGLATGVPTGLVSVPITACFLWIYHHRVNPRWMDHLVEFERVRMQRSGIADSTAATRLDALRASGTDSAQVVGAIIGTLILSFALSLIITALLRRRRGPAV